MEERMAELEADLQSFLTSEWITVPIAFYPHENKSNGDSFMAKLRNEDEIWEIRSRAPAPGIRVLGRFALKDKFVALTWAWRRELDGEGSPNWREVINVCGAEWRRIFPTYKPHSGDYPYDYLTGASII